MTQAEIDAGGNLSNTVTADSAESAPDTDTLNIPITQPGAQRGEVVDDDRDYDGGPWCRTRSW